ncbi:hypothetical protein CN683_24600 [Bacillus toyonensis]|uniref:hypothetical protein n=1 Tax=Bacillus cereus group TaxID=86661 RepID=UPI000BF0D317|nr:MULTISPECIES: hypothetical protein [Bacillus cereus group]PEK11721.1 hypothetical protein CN683_24600 [Bacillus toyonensis]PFF74096.1 hypothetical protein CN341_23355 [Bacillus cereus]PGC88877.1 hypothetical protein COM29_10445 [Bacillus toyonensis]
MNYQEELERLFRSFPEEGGFHDQYGYIVHQIKEPMGTVLKPDARGEATLYTAIAAVAIATSNYKQDNWDEKFANEKLKELLTTLIEKSWGNKDNLGREHPIRHPKVIDYYRDGNDVRNRMSPLSKDSFGAILAASYYSYSCPNTSQEVRKLARDLITKWTEYLTFFQWRTHSIYIEGEFESDGEKYKNIYSDNNLTHQKSYKGIESFMLWPHEMYALQNVAAHLGILKSPWKIWENIIPELNQTFTDYAVPYIAQYAGEAFDNLLKNFQPHTWNFGIVEGTFKVEISSDIREQVVITFKDAIENLLREIVRIGNYIDYQKDGILGILINHVLNFFPDVLGPNSWRSILTKSLELVLPWITGSGWIEALTFIGSLQLLKKMDTSTVSYTLWIYCVECEIRPEMTDILKTALQDFYSYLRSNDNPNSLWAWIAEDSGRVSEHLKLFESHEWDYWWKFAYQEKKFNDWLKEPEDLSTKEVNQLKDCPRLDFLVLSGLAEKGVPVGIFH